MTVDRSFRKSNMAASQS